MSSVELTRLFRKPKPLIDTHLASIQGLYSKPETETGTEAASLSLCHWCSHLAHSRHDFDHKVNRWWIHNVSIDNASF